MPENEKPLPEDAQESLETTREELNTATAEAREEIVEEAGGGGDGPGPY